jgi:glycerophosphoryl diester phosphodiesterase
MRKWTILLLIGEMFMAGCTLIASHAPRPRVGVIAHRGASEQAPENTLAAFALAARLGADWFELDCQLTRDGEIMVLHDSTLERTTNGKGYLAAFDRKELKELDAGKWKGPRFAGERLPTLEEALLLARKEGIGVYIEIKGIRDDTALEQRILAMASENPTGRGETIRGRMAEMIERDGTRTLELSRKVIALVRRLEMGPHVVLQSFSPIHCAVVRHEAPDLRVELLAAYDSKKPAEWENTLRWADLLDVAGCNLSASSVTPERVEKFQRAGRTVAVWTVDEKAEMERQAKMGVDAIITDRPDLCLRVLQGLGKR